MKLDQLCAFQHMQIPLAPFFTTEGGANNVKLIGSGQALNSAQQQEG
jgi:hypothetical protein